jgi:hypothetical protein
LVEGGAWQNGYFYPLAEDAWQELHDGIIALQEYAPPPLIPRLPVKPEAVTQRIPRVVEPEVKPGDHQANYLETAKAQVRQTVLSNYWMDGDPEFEVYIVWFCKTLQNWKALVGTTLQDAMYFEVTHNGNKHETYIDCYKKIEQVTYYE